MAVEAAMSLDRITLTVEEAGGRLGISRTLAYELVRRGEIPSIRLGRRVLVPIQALDRMVASASDDSRRASTPARRPGQSTRPPAGQLLAVDDAAEVFGGLAVGGAAGLGVVLDEDLGAVALALGDHADVEAGVEELARRELA
jgi:excisionase family DNA binding protein